MYYICAINHVILISTCFRANADHSGCSLASAQSLIESACNGQTTCTLVANNVLFPNPCYGIIKYVNVTYWCDFQGEV